MTWAEGGIAGDTFYTAMAPSPIHDASLVSTLCPAASATAALADRDSARRSAWIAAAATPATMASESMATPHKDADHSAAGATPEDARPITDADREAHELLVEQLFAQDEVAGELGITASTTTPGHAIATMEADDRMINGYGVVHGGYIFLLADAAFALACVSPRGPAVSRQAEITFVTPARAGDTLRAVAVERTTYGRSGIYDVTVSGPDGTVYAEMRGHSQVVTGGFPPPRPPRAQDS